MINPFDIDHLLATPGGRLEIYNSLVELGYFSSKRDFVNWLADLSFGEEAKKARRDEFKKRCLRKLERGRIEARRIDYHLWYEVVSSGPCVYCGDPSEQVDHILPVSRGGGRNRRNLAPVCRPCNQEKWNMTVDEWREFRRRIGEPWPPLPQVNQKAA